MEEDIPTQLEVVHQAHPVGANSQLYEWVILKQWKEAEDFLSDEEIENEQKVNSLCYQDEDNGHTPLIRAVLKQSAPTSLLKNMIRIGGLEMLQIKNESDWTILHWVAYSNHVSIETFKLILHKCDLVMISSKNNYNNTALEILLEKGHAESIHKIQALLAKEQQLTKSNSSMSQTISWARELPKKEQIHVFKNDAFKNMLNAMFISPQFLFVAMADFYIQFAVVLVFSYLVQNSIAKGDVGVLPSILILFFALLWFLIRKTTQLVTSYLKTFFLDPMNVLDIIHFVLLIGSISIISVEGLGSSGLADIELSTIDRTALTLATCASWLKLLFVIGNLYYSVAVFVVAMITVSVITKNNQEHTLSF
jgi:hypothetical protein